MNKLTRIRFSQLQLELLNNIVERARASLNKNIPKAAMIRVLMRISLIDPPSMDRIVQLLRTDTVKRGRVPTKKGSKK